MSEESTCSPNFEIESQSRSRSSGTQLPQTKLSPQHPKFEIRSTKQASLRRTSAMKPSSNITPPEAPKIYDPDSLSDNDLLWMPLRGLTRNLSTKVSERATSAVYLRWLEVHRATPS